MPSTQPATPAPANRWLVRPRPLTQPLPRSRLFCFPYAGGSAAIYHQWPNSLLLDVELIAVQYPGRGARLAETPLDRLDQLLDGIEQAILPLLQQPFAFFGHSMGATVAFELARRLRAKGQPLPRHLFLSGRSAPQMPLLKQPIHALPEPQFVESMRAFNGTPAEILDHRELMEMMLPMLRADFKALETWQHQDAQPLDIPISVFGGLSDPAVPIENLDAWAAHSTQKTKRHLFPGDHFYLQHQYPAMLNIIGRAIAHA